MTYIQDLSNEALTYFSSQFPGQSVGNGLNNEFDAFRHAYTSAVMAYEFGDAVSAAAGWAHEMKNLYLDTPPEPLNQ